MKLWAKIIKGEKLINNIVWSNNLTMTKANYEATLMEICHALDIETPVTLNTHYRYLVDFNIVKFLPRDFVDKVDYTLFTIENIE